MTQRGLPDSGTSLSLLSALRDDVRRHAAWDDFVDRYGPRIESWCRRWGLQAADADDVKQNVLLQLARQMETFRYDPKGRFRSWLKTIAWRAWADYLKARSRNPADPVAAEFAALDSAEARDDLMRRLDDEANREVLEVAISRVRNRVQDNTFEAFRLMTFEQKSGAETADVLNMTVGAVFVAKSRVDRMLSEEVARIDPE